VISNIMLRKAKAFAAVATIALFATRCSPAWSQKKPCPALRTSVLDHKFQPGQIWAYESRANETTSTLTVLRIDSSAKIGTIVQVRIDGLKARNPRGEIVPSVEHMPFTRDAILRSVTRLLKSNQPIPTLEGLDRWQSDCGGVYSISVRDAIDVMEKTLNAP
jgi:hypothetical protein